MSRDILVISVWTTARQSGSDDRATGIGEWGYHTLSELGAVTVVVNLGLGQNSRSEQYDEHQEGVQAYREELGEFGISILHSRNVPES